SSLQAMNDLPTIRVSLTRHEGPIAKSASLAPFHGSPPCLPIRSSSRRVIPNLDISHVLLVYEANLVVLGTAQQVAVGQDFQQCAGECPVSVQMKGNNLGAWIGDLQVSAGHRFVKLTFPAAVMDSHTAIRVQGHDFPRPPGAVPLHVDFVPWAQRSLVRHWVAEEKLVQGTVTEWTRGHVSAAANRRRRDCCAGHQTIAGKVFVK